MELSEIPAKWDLLVIGGGITGAGVLCEASRLGIRALLCEERDFAWGTSSRSSKLVHGGLRYLKEGRFHLTYQSVKNRQRLLAEAPGLVTPLAFLLPVRRNLGPGRRGAGLGLFLYDMLAGRQAHSYLAREDFAFLAPGLKQEGLQGGFLFQDAQTDDARLVLRLIFEAMERGAEALNYTRVKSLLRDTSGRVSGALLEDSLSGETREVLARAVVNATGPRAENFQRSPEPRLRLRPLRGGHLVFPHWSLPVRSAITLIHPRDLRPLFIFPWEGVLILGTTDVEHCAELSEEPALSPQEATYMMECLGFHFPSWQGGLGQALCGYAGIRAVLSQDPGKEPSRESREHAVWKDKGLVTVTGGKLTTFRLLAKDALSAVAGELGLSGKLSLSAPAYEPVPQPLGIKSPVSPKIWMRLLGRYGKKAMEILEKSPREELEPIPGTCTLWAEVSHAARSERVRRLEDLLLRRVRLGITSPRGGLEHLERIREICGPALGWDSSKWEKEKTAYVETLGKFYAVPDVREKQGLENSL